MHTQTRKLAGYLGIGKTEHWTHLIHLRLKPLTTNTLVTPTSVYGAVVLGHSTASRKEMDLYRNSFLGPLTRWTLDSNMMFKQHN